jgi:hypothetical protein
MRSRSFRRCLSRWRVGLSLAMYAAAGLFGHALHDLLPCEDQACARWEDADGACGCGHDHDGAVAPAGSRQCERGAAVTQPGHDSEHCSLCSLLAKIGVGRVELFKADLHSAAVAHEPLVSVIALPRDPGLTRAPRGPPLV